MTHPQNTSNLCVKWKVPISQTQILHKQTDGQTDRKGNSYNPSAKLRLRGVYNIHTKVRIDRMLEIIELFLFTLFQYVGNISFSDKFFYLLIRF